MWTFTGFDASAHVSEETHDPSRRAPRGILSAVLVSAVCGYALLVAMTLALPDADQSALGVLRAALGESWGNAAMILPILAMAFCGLSAVTSASRMLFAFARDGGVPFSEALRAVSPRWRTPHAATWAIGLATLALVLGLAPVSEELFNAVAVLATSGLYISYLLPIALGFVARRRGTWQKLGPFHLGRASAPVAVIAVLWSAIVVLVCVLANPLSGAILAGLLGGLFVLYFAWVRRRFRGPRVGLAELSR